MILSLSPLTSELCRFLLRVCSPVPSWPLTTLALPCVLFCTRLPLCLPSLAPAGPVLVTAFCYCSSRGTAPSLLVFPDSAHTFINASLSIPSSVTQSEWAVRFLLGPWLIMDAFRKSISVSRKIQRKSLKWIHVWHVEGTVRDLAAEQKKRGGR